MRMLDNTRTHTLTHTPNNRHNEYITVCIRADNENHASFSFSGQREMSVFPSSAPVLTWLFTHTLPEAY